MEIRPTMASATPQIHTSATAPQAAQTQSVAEQQPQESFLASADGPVNLIITNDDKAKLRKSV